MCYDIDGTLKHTRPAETAFDIIFVINIIVSLITLVTEDPLLSDKELIDTFKKSSISYLK